MRSIVIMPECALEPGPAVPGRGPLRVMFADKNNVCASGEVEKKKVMTLKNNAKNRKARRGMPRRWPVGHHADMENGRGVLPPRLAAGAARVAVTTAAIAATAVTTTAAVAGRWATEAAAITGGGRGTSEATAVASSAAATTAELAEIARTTATTSATTTSTAATAATKGRLTGNGLEEGRDLLIGLLQQIKQLPHDAAVAAVEERGRETSVSGTAGTTDTVDVVINVGGKVVVDHVCDVGDIETTSGNSSGDQDGATAIAEHLQGALTLTLSTITVDRGGGEVLVDEEVRERVRHALGLDENEGQASTVGVEDVEKDGALIDILDILDLLRDVLRGRTDTANRQEDIVLQEVTSQHLDVAREGGREHERLAVLHAGHILALDDTANLGLETHVEHAISLIEHKILNVAQGDATTFYEIDQSARGGNKQVASALDLAELGSDISATVDDAWANPGPVGELAGLLVDLGDKLTGGGKDERGRVSLALTSKAAALTTGSGRGSLEESLRQNGEEEATSLAGTGLRTSHEVSATHDNRDRVLLHRGRNGVPSELDVRDEMVIERRVGELQDGLGDIVT